jgi:hypothetical protein
MGSRCFDWRVDRLVAADWYLGLGRIRSYRSMNGHRDYDKHGCGCVTAMVLILLGFGLALLWWITAHSQ